MECLSFCIADSIDLARLDVYCKTNLAGYISGRSRDVVKLNALNSPGLMLFVFKNGTVVSWGIKRHQIASYLETIKQFAIKPIQLFVHDEFSYQLGNKTAIAPHAFFDVDCFLIEHEGEDIKLSLSYGFSQSVKLQYFETIIDSLIEKCTPIIQGLPHKRKQSITREQIRQILGQIVAAKSEMNLISNFLYLPKYFWQHPTLEEHYTMLERYLHIQRRINALNHRLDTLNEIFDMFNSYLENRHAHHLEVIIIVLIAIEILFAVLNFHI